MLALNTQASARHPSIVSTKHFLRSWPHLRTALSPPHMNSMSFSNASTLIYGQPRCFVAVQASALPNTAAVDELAPARQLLDCYWQVRSLGTRCHWPSFTCCCSRYIATWGGIKPHMACMHAGARRVRCVSSFADGRFCCWRAGRYSRASTHNIMHMPEAVANSM